MRSRLADYQILGPAGLAGAWLAAAPARLGGEAPVVVTEVGDGTVDWPALALRLTSLAAVRSSFLPRMLEAGQTDEADGTVTWVTREDGRPRRSAGPTDPDAALHQLASAARGAHDLHEAGWVHGDIRPRSLLARDDDTLLDPPIRALTRPAIPEGPLDLDTVEPASIWGEGPSRAADIWALGATAHWLLTGSPVHPALVHDPLAAAVQRVLIEPPVVADTLPTAITELLRSCLAPDPADRPATAADLADRFERLAATR